MRFVLPLTASDRSSQRSRRAFTITELLIVIFVIGLLTSLLVVGASKTIAVQRANSTRATMNTITVAIEQFGAENPLRASFDSHRLAFDTRPPPNEPQRFTLEPSFGKYPPYALAGNARRTSYPTQAPLRSIVEPTFTSPGGDVPPPPANFAERIAMSLGWNPNNASTGALNKWVTPRTGFADRWNDDNRALYTYLRLYSPGSLAGIPTNAIRPLSSSPEYVFPNHDGDTFVAGGVPPKSAVDILGFYDAWGVPMDYFLYVKVEFVAGDDGIPRWRITDRRPVLRSQGLTKEEYVAGKRDESRALYSEPLPSPVAEIKADTGLLATPNPLSEANAARVGGWARLRAGSGPGNGGERDTVEDYGYR